MNERFKLNSEKLREWIDGNGLKQTFVAKQLGISDSLLDKMLGSGHVPKARKVSALAVLMGVTEDQLLIPKKSESKKTA